MAVIMPGNLAEFGTSPQPALPGPDGTMRSVRESLHGPLNLFSRLVVGFEVGAWRATAHQNPGW